VSPSVAVSWAPEARFSEADSSCRCCSLGPEDMGEEASSRKTRFDSVVQVAFAAKGAAVPPEVCPHPGRRAEPESTQMQSESDLSPAGYRHRGHGRRRGSSRSGQEGWGPETSLCGHRERQERAGPTQDSGLNCKFVAVSCLPVYKITAPGRQPLGVTVMLCAVKGQWTTVCASGRSR